LKAEKKYDNESNVIPEKLEIDKVKRSAKRVIIMISSLGALHEKVFSK
jgi:hypothetical protein